MAGSLFIVPHCHSMLNILCQLNVEMLEMDVSFSPISSVAVIIQSCTVQSYYLLFEKEIGRSIC